MELSFLSDFWSYILIALLFGGSIFIHELGHFLTAKAFGLKVLRFSIGFGPKIAQWKGKDGCKYVLSLLPLGGYVAIPQLVDMGKLEGEEDDDNVKTKNLPKASCIAKICVSAAGAIFNLILAFILAVIVWWIGIPEQEVMRTTQIGSIDNIVDANGIEHESPAKLAGLKEGDIIVSIDNKKVESFEDIIELIAMGAGRNKNGQPLTKIEVLRNGKSQSFEVPTKLIKTNISTGDEIRMIGIKPAMRMIVGEIMANSPAQKAGFKIDDEVVGINSQKIYSPSHMSKVLENEKDIVDVDIIRNGKELKLTVQPKRVFLTKPLLKIKIDSGEVNLLHADKNNRLLVFSASPETNINTTDILYQINDNKVNKFVDIRAVLQKNRGSSVLKFVDKNYNMKEVGTSVAILEDIPAKSRIMLGYQLKDTTFIRHPSISEQFTSSVDKVVNALSSLLNPKSDIGISSLAGPVDIGRVIYKLSDTAIMLVISFTVLLNINLAILNLLPIPVLDGGHIIFAIVEKLRGKPISATFFATLQTFFALLFMALMFYVVYTGFARWDGDNKLEKQSEIYKHYYIQTKF